jgi:hypothetical protein
MAMLIRHAHGPSAWDSVLREGGALLFVTATLSVVWDLRGRRQLTNEVLSAAGLSKAITDAGLTELTTHYAEIDWNGLLNRASHVDLFFAYVMLGETVSGIGALLSDVFADKPTRPQIHPSAGLFAAAVPAGRIGRLRFVETGPGVQTCYLARPRVSRDQSQRDD